ncbi:MAG TPA: hypothetical protein VGN79_03315 [Devosia sp.]|nr:hypothetical protein [Devosia sp.]
MPDLIISLIVALVFSAIHIFGYRLTFLESTPRSVWLSVAGGVSVAYVFVHLLPELAEHQEGFREAAGSGGALRQLESHIYLIALTGLAVFYGLDRLMKSSALQEERAGRSKRPRAGAFWLHLGSFAVYNLLIGYLLLHRDESDLRGLALYAFAMALHFIVNDHALREHHGETYDHKGRWLLAATPLLGWFFGVFVTFDELAIGALFAFLAGGVVLNVLKEELPEERESRFWAFAVGAAAYAALLLAT